MVWIYIGKLPYNKTIGRVISNKKLNNIIIFLCESFMAFIKWRGVISYGQFFLESLRLKREIQNSEFIFPIVKTEIGLKIAKMCNFVFENKVSSCHKIIFFLSLEHDGVNCDC